MVEILDEGEVVVGRAVGGHARRGVAAVVVGDHAVAPREVAHLRLPRAVIARELVAPDEGKATGRLARPDPARVPADRIAPSSLVGSATYGPGVRVRVAAPQARSPAQTGKASRRRRSRPSARWASSAPLAVKRGSPRSSAVADRAARGASGPADHSER